ncbi:MAG: Phytoene synthase [uncultured Cytophagales bacterium]|uniref:Phytoene synthase n=1 Tax=uncultured Cytophagales bacterium TaxID=158755 RepID=A0A6J4JSU6_9SPHI|nr:MAG: Phytoene synthase [uncultured Cytophagales bacterium]
MELFDETTLKCSRLITQHYSTSFTLGIKTLEAKYRLPIYAVYGFVRYADEIVDTFHDYDKAELLSSFRADTYKAIRDRISLNPVLHSFQLIVNQYGIDRELIEAFLKSMEMDLHQQEYNQYGYAEYIYGSAEVVGLMCLRVFCEGNTQMYESLKEPARRLGAAFQKVNFLRDIRSDYQDRGRVYFPGINFNAFTETAKRDIEADIQADFDAAYQGIIRLPQGAKWGVYLAYVYYKALFKKIKKMAPSRILNERIRVPDNQKMALLVQTYFQHKLNYL